MVNEMIKDMNSMTDIFAHCCLGGTNQFVISRTIFMLIKDDTV